MQEWSDKNRNERDSVFARFCALVAVVLGSVQFILMGLRTLSGLLKLLSSIK